MSEPTGVTQLRAMLDAARHGVVFTGAGISTESGIPDFRSPGGIWTRMAPVITQNIDGLHQASGVPDRQVIELHGNTTYAACLDCGERHELTPIRAAFERDAMPPRCVKCEGLVKTATISFGQSMPVLPMQLAEAATLAADLFIVLGSSLVVYPAAGFPELAKHNGARLVIVNREETGLDRYADLVLHAPIGDTLGGAVGVN